MPDFTDNDLAADTSVPQQQSASPAPTGTFTDKDLESDAQKAPSPSADFTNQAIAGDVTTQESQYPKQLLGSAYTQIRGHLHGLAAGLGWPVDLVASAMRSAGLPIPQDPFLGSGTFRKLLDVPGRVAGIAVNPLLDSWFGEGTSKKYGFTGHATYNDINEVPEEYRPQARLGEMIGASLPMIAAPILAGGADVAGSLAAARMAPSGSVMTDVGRTLAGQAALPGYGRAAMASVIGAGLGSYGAEAVFPGSETAQVIGQLGGGLLGAPAEVSRLAETVRDVPGAAAARSVIPKSIKMLTEQPETAVARALEPQFAKYGEDVSQIIANLKAPAEVPGILPAEKAKSNVLMGVEQALSKNDPDLANAIMRSHAQYEQNLLSGVQQSFEPGTQAALTAAAARKETTLNNFLDGLVNRSEQAAQEAASPVAPLGPAEREAANVRARSLIEQSLSSARAKENQLWSSISKDTPVSAVHSVAAFNDVKDEMIPGAHLPAAIENTMKVFADKPMQTLGMMQNLRSELLNEARKARAADDYNTARRLNIIANGTGDETGGALADMASAGDPNVAPALKFSRMLNEKFSRGFVGDVLGTKQTGEPAIRPALTLESAAAGTPSLAAQRFKELREGTAPIEGGPSSTDMASAQEQYLRSLSQNIIDPASGRIKVKPATAFMRNYSQILDQFPAYTDTLKKAIASQMASENIGEKVSDTVKAANNTAFAKVLKAGEIPSRAIKTALDGANPVNDFKKISALARSGGPQAVAGLRASILDYVSDNAMTNSGVSFRNMKQILETPLAPGGPSLLKAMQDNRIISDIQADNITRKAELGIRHEEAPQNAVRVDNVGDEASRYARWAARYLGVKLAGKLNLLHGGAGESLQVANIVASAAERQLARMPIEKSRMIISKAMQETNPEKLIDILERVGGVPMTALRRQPSLIPYLRPLVPLTQSKPTMVGPGDVMAQ